MKFSPLCTLLIAIFISLVLSQCKPSAIEASNSFDFANVLNVYGPKTPSKSDKIFIDLKKDQVLALTAEEVKKHFSIQPKIHGEITIQEEHIVVFKPTSTFDSDTKYSIKLSLNNLVKDPKTLKEKDFVFNFSTLPQRAKLKFKDYYAEDDQWKILLRAKLNDTESIANLTEAFSAKQGSKNLEYTVNQISPYEVEYLVEGFDVESRNSSLDFQLNKSSLSLDQNSLLNFEIPDSNKFELLKVDNSDLSKLSFIFTKILDKNQNLNGLVKLSESKKAPKYKIEGNRLHVFPDKKNSHANEQIILSEKIKSSNGLTLANQIVHQTGNLALIPKLKNIGIGHVVPNSDRVVFPFEAKGLNNVYLEIFKIYSKNLQQFYQQNKTDSYYNLEYVGETVHSQRIALSDLSREFNPLEMKRYYFDLKDYISSDKNAIYQIRIGFVPQDLAESCDEELSYDFDLDGKSLFGRSYYGIFGSIDNYSWENRDKPCMKEFYNSDKYISKLILASNLGLLAKKSENGDMLVVVNDLISAAPISGAEVSIYSKSQKLLLSSKTDKRGMLKAENLEEAFLVKVQKSSDENWIRVDDRDALSLSKYDIAGRTKKKGLDGYIYGERNIWRPGDTMHLNFILFDEQDKIPEGHPVKLSVTDPKARVVFQEKLTDNIGPIHYFPVPTSRDFTTGNYTVTAQVGSSKFTKFIKVENIKPNKFVISSDLENAKLSDHRSSISSGGKDFDYQVNWLYGAPAKNKRLQVEMKMKKARTTFQKFSEYQFVDSRNYFEANESQVIADTKTDNTGKARVKLKLKEDLEPQGKLSLQFKNTAYESSGDFSSDAFTVTYSPYDYYAGIRMPKDEYNYERSFVNTETTIKLASVNADGDISPRRKLKATIYKMENYWWYNRYNNEFDMTNMSSHASQDKFSVTTDSKGEAEIITSFNTNGRYYIKVCDELSGHCASDYLYVGYAWDDQEMSSTQYAEAAQLNISSSKKSYEVGETAELIIPSYFEGKALVSLESGDKIVESFWTKVRRGNNKITFSPQLSMFPTIYAHVTLLQEHTDKANDMPLRLYGVIPIAVEDETLKLIPELKMNDEVKPDEKFEVRIEEKEGRAMYYTLAIVDEGLLNISRFKTPDPFKHFYSRPSLGVRTFDMYNDVLSAYGSKVSNMFSIGGDMENVKIEEDTRANRFRPVVQHIGPFFLDENAKRVHEFEIMNYIGAVRVMLVATEGNSFGSVEKKVPVRQDLMVLGTLPRTLSPGDRLDVPISIFTMKDGVGEVEYGINSKNNLLDFQASTGAVSFSEMDEKMERLPALVGQEEGIDFLEFVASSSKMKSTQGIEIDVRNPNPISRAVDKKFISAGESIDIEIEPLGDSKQEMSISMSSLSPVNVKEQLDRLSRYPYGCLEQRTSAAIAYLYQDDLIETTASQDQYAKTIVEDLINDLYKFENVSGYSLWPSSPYYDSWVSSYVGDFLSQAQEQGFNIPQGSLNNWLTKQKDRAISWKTYSQDKSYIRNRSLFNQAYRLYTLAKAKAPLLGEMNRLKEDYSLDVKSTILLAGAYAEAGQNDVAKSMLQANGAMNVVESSGHYGYYGSLERNQALLLSIYHDVGDENKAAEAMLELNKSLSKKSYLSTQTASFVLQALAKFAKTTSLDKNVQVDFTKSGTSTQSLSSSTGTMMVESTLPSPTSVNIVNKSKGPIFVELARRGKKRLGSEESRASKLQISTRYVDADYKTIDPSMLSQGVDFKMITKISRSKIDVSNFENLALRQVIPSGWEIVNDRIFDFGTSSSSDVDYQDFGDNQVNSFFSLEKKESVTIEIKLKATYAGQFYHPLILCESMYENDIYAEQKGFPVEVVQ